MKNGTLLSEAFRRQGVFPKIFTTSVLAGEKSGGLVEVQGTAEGAPFSRAELDAMVDLAAAGIRELIAGQRASLGV